MNDCERVAVSESPTGDSTGEAVVVGDFVSGTLAAVLAVAAADSAAVDATAAAGLRQMSRLPPPEQRTYWGMVPKEYDDFEEGSTRIFRLRGMVGDAFCQLFLEIKRAEWDAYSQQVSAWEWQRYAGFF